MIKINNSHIKLGDIVEIKVGTKKGLRGKVINILRPKNSVLLDTITSRIRYSHNKKSEPSKKIIIQQRIPISNIMLWDVKTNSSSKVGFKIIKGTKKRYFKKSGFVI
jgi:large subunit ribosomal protein L24